MHRRAVLVCAAFALATAVMVAAGYYVVFENIDPYDDEGYVVISLWSYLRGGRLYEDVFSQYGPFFFQATRALMAATGIACTPSGGRAVTLVWWSTTALACGLAVWWTTRRLALALCVEFLVFGTLTSTQVTHPGGFISVLLGLLVATVAAPGAPWRAPRLLMVGAIVTAVTLVKVNVGVFVAAGVGLAVVCATTQRVGLRAIVVALYVALPLVLMAPQLTTVAVATLATHLVFSLMAVGLAEVTGRPAPLPWRCSAWLVTGAAGMALVSVGIEIARGNDLATLVQGAVVRVASIPSIFSRPLALEPPILPWSATMLGLCILVHGRWKERWTTARGARERALARVVAGVLMLLSGLNPSLLLTVATPLAWLVIPGPQEAAGSPVLVRRVLAALAPICALHAFPVGGSQVAWGTLLLLPLAGTCLGDGLAGTERTAARSPAGRLPWWMRALPVGVLACAAYGAVYIPGMGYRNAYVGGIPIGLPGAERIRLPANVVWPIRTTAGIVRLRCSTFIGLPGANSLYFFTEREPPTMLNVGNWAISLTDTEQERIIAALDQARAPCVVRNQFLAAAWKGDITTTGPLERYIAERFEVLPWAGAFGNTEIMVPRREHPVPGARS
jgi:hypothetical protein